MKLCDIRNPGGKYPLLETDSRGEDHLNDCVVVSEVYMAL